jgi:hypothetical protein
MSDDEHPDAAIVAGARWSADQWHVAPQPIKRTLREMFSLGFDDACKVMAEATDGQGRAP